MKQIFYYSDSPGNTITFEIVTQCIYLKAYDVFLLGDTRCSLPYIYMKLSDEYAGVTVTYYYVLLRIIRFLKNL